MNINPQFTFDKNGNPIGVFITIEEWSELTNDLNLELPQWQRDALDLEIKGIESIPYSNGCKHTLQPHSP